MHKFLFTNPSSYISSNFSWQTATRTKQLRVPLQPAEGQQDILEVCRVQSNWLQRTVYQHRVVSNSDARPSQPSACVVREPGRVQDHQRLVWNETTVWLSETRGNRPRSSPLVNVSENCSKSTKWTQFSKSGKFLISIQPFYTPLSLFVINLLLLLW